MSEPALVVEVDASGTEALVELRGALRRLSIDVLTLEGHQVVPGQWLLTSAGLAVAPLAPTEAQELRDLLDRAHEEERR